MRIAFTALLAIALLASSERVFAHGFALSVSADAFGNPTALAEQSNQQVLDQDNVTAGPNKLFLDTFFVQDSGPNVGQIGTYEGPADCRPVSPLGKCVLHHP